MFNFSRYMLCIILLGVVDQVHDRTVLVELSSLSGNVNNLEMPLWLFPCDVQEGDFFYVESIDEVTEIRCGKPPE